MNGPYCALFIQVAGYYNERFLSSGGLVKWGSEPESELEKSVSRLPVIRSFGFLTTQATLERKGAGRWPWGDGKVCFCQGRCSGLRAIKQERTQTCGKLICYGVKKVFDILEM